MGDSSVSEVSLRGVHFLGVKEFSKYISCLGDVADDGYFKLLMIIASCSPNW